MNRLLSISLLGLMILLLGGCSRTHYLSMDILGDSEMNNGGNFVIVRVYQLTNDTNFSNAEYRPFWGDDDAILGAELINGTKQQISLFPPDPQRLPEPQELSLELNDATKFVGVAAKLYSPDGNRWRQVYSIEQLEKRKVVVSIKGNHILVDLYSE